jgi:hypothetical protein
VGGALHDYQIRRDDELQSCGLGAHREVTMNFVWFVNSRVVHIEPGPCSEMLDQAPIFTSKDPAEALVGGRHVCRACAEAFFRRYFALIAALPSKP